jgi:hypothetical protein
MRIDREDPDPRWCAIPAEEMEAWREFLASAGSTRQPVDLQRLYTTALVDQVNAFDPDPVRLAARTRIFST